MRKRAAALSVLSNTSVLVLKIGAAGVTGSVSVLSEALHTGTDLLASLMAYFSVKKAEEPADETHPFGHGKMENLSGLVEAALVLVAAGLVIYHAVEKLTTKAEMQLPWIAFGVMVVGATANFIVSRYLYRVARQTDSMALEADALHLSVDVYTSAAVAVGLLVVALTNWRWVDPVLAIGVALFIFYEGLRLSYDAMQSLLDRALPEHEREAIEKVLKEHQDLIKEYHDLRTRKAGPFRYVDLHITVCRNQDISTVHKTMDSIEEAVKDALPNTDVVIHPEPCEHHHKNCPDECYWVKLMSQERKKKDK